MIAAFIQARMSSKRFPNKVLKPILGRPMLELEIERVKLCETIDRVVVLTSTSSEDRQIVDLGKRLKVSVFCGNLENVLDRFYQAALKFKPDHIVRLTGDCPLIDMSVIDALVRIYLNKKGDYGTNCMPPTYPDGLDAEIFAFKALQEAHSEALLPSQLEHISLFFEGQPKRFKIVNLASNKDLSALRWTVDEPEDFEFVKTIYEKLYPLNPCFGMNDILALLEKNPGLSVLNQGFLRNEGLMKSKEKDRSFLKKSAQ
ncbi:MAG: glycosyltransferase family protein [Candidatus Omnitrophota bacterium]|jgi:spore coat polysaccharide biosynthesis protein SpsF